MMSSFTYTNTPPKANNFSFSAPLTPVYTLPKLDDCKQVDTAYLNRDWFAWIPNTYVWPSSAKAFSIDRNEVYERDPSITLYSRELDRFATLKKKILQQPTWTSSSSDMVNFVFTMASKELARASSLRDINIKQVWMQKIPRECKQLAAVAAGSSSSPTMNYQWRNYFEEFFRYHIITLQNESDRFRALVPLDNSVYPLNRILKYQLPIYDVVPFNISVSQQTSTNKHKQQNERI